MTGFKMSIIEYLRSEYPDNYQWWFVDDNLMLEHTSSIGISTCCYTADQLSHIKNTFDAGGMYSFGTSGRTQPLWQRELELLLEGS
jgi:hypothetical protein